MEEITEKREYLLHTRVDCTWEEDEVIESAYSNVVSDYQSKFRNERDVIKVEENIVGSNQEEGQFSMCAEDLCDDTNFKKYPLGKDVAETGSLDFSVECKLKTDKFTSETKTSSGCRSTATFSSKKDDESGKVYLKFISDHQSNIHYVSDIIKVEDNLDALSTEVERASSTCWNVGAELCEEKDINNIKVEDNLDALSTEVERASSTSWNIGADFCEETDINNIKKDPLGNGAAETDSLSNETEEFSVNCKLNPDELTFQMRANYVTIFSENTISCRRCSYICSNESDLTRHMLTHSAEKPFSCSLCSYSCSQKVSLTKHMRTHSGEKPYSCSECSYSCSQKSNLTKHLRTHTGEKPHACNQCSYSCSTKSQLKRHMLTHSGVKPYSCTQCPYSCSQKSSLTTHLLTHTGDRPYSCTQCSYTCLQKAHLTRHMRTHSGDKP